MRAPQIRLGHTVTDEGDAVTVAWRHQPASDIESTAPAAGSITVPTSTFDAAVTEFDRAFFAAMDERISALEAAGPPRGVHLDVEQLRREHQIRATHLSQARARQASTDWAAVRAGTLELIALKERAR